MLSGDMLQAEAYFDLDALGRYLPLFEGVGAVWEALDRLKNFIKEIIRPNLPTDFLQGVPLAKSLVLYEGKAYCLEDGFDLRLGERPEVLREGRVLHEATLVMAGAVLWGEIELGPGVVVEPGALIKGPSIIGARAEIRQGAYVRGNCIIGEDCVVGHTTEIKHSIMLSGAKAGHFAYIGDSILGLGVNLGAGTKLANLKMRPGTVRILWQGKSYDTGRCKLGAILGDGVQTGCNSVTNPGVLLGPSSLIFPGLAVPSGIYPAKSFLRP